VRYLALDVGTRRVGVAVGSSETRLATPLAVIERRNVHSDAEKIRALAAEYEADALVVGVPLELDGAQGDQANAVLQYANALRAALRMPVEFFDERYSTSIALTRRRDAGISEKRGRTTIDAAAAAVILQDFLDARAIEAQGTRAR
jgi:putative Holliday junction resolvase